MLFRETVAVYCENHTEHTNTLCGQSVGFLYVKAGGTYSNDWALDVQLQGTRFYVKIKACLRRTKIKCKVALYFSTILCSRMGKKVKAPHLLNLVSG
jgi:hypothetical protein